MSRFAIALTGALLGVLLAVPPAYASSDLEQAFVDHINRERRTNGIPNLGIATDLTNAARDHSRKMAATSTLHHNPNLQSICCWSRITENIGRGSSATSLMQAFMDSSKHRGNILDPRVSQVGVGVHLSGSTIWVTQVFRSPDATAPASLSAPEIAATSGIAVMGDWNGDGVSTPGWFKDGAWTLSNSLDGSDTYTLQYGRRGDKPVVGDWNGDGKQTIGVVRGNTWILRRTYTRGDDVIMDYGRVDDTPVTGDWNGNGIDTIGVVRGNRWILRPTYQRGNDIVLDYGRTTDLKVTGDWNGNGIDTIGVVRGNRWILRPTYQRGNDIVLDYGRTTDLKVTGDFNNDGRDTLGVVRNLTWILRYEYRSGADIVTNF